MLPEVFAVVREAGKRTLGMRHFDVQIMGGQVLYEGHIAEMKTGEGKTLVATLAGVCARARRPRRSRRHRQRLPGTPRRGVDGRRSISSWADRRHHSARARLGRSAAQPYNCDITYVTNNEVGFDYLRDNMAWQVRRHGAARAVLRARRRSRLDPDRRSAHAADHQRSVARIDRTVREIRANHSALEKRRGLYGRRKGACRSDHRSRASPKSRRCSAFRISTISATSS